jgi:hypothetical protein
MRTMIEEGRHAASLIARRKIDMLARAMSLSV